MTYARLTRGVAQALVLVCLCACNPIIAATPAPSQPDTEAILFAPDSIAQGPDQGVVAGVCEPSPLLPRPGAYRCTTEVGATLDPCFTLEGGMTVGCDPNPVAGTYVAIVAPTAPLLLEDGAEDPLPFYLNLGPSKPLCAVGPDSPKELAGQPVTFACQAPGAWIAGPLDTAQSVWLAAYTVTNSAGTEVTYGPEASPVAQAWLY